MIQDTGSGRGGSTLLTSSSVNASKEKLSDREPFSPGGEGYREKACKVSVKLGFDSVHGKERPTVLNDSLRLKKSELAIAPMASGLEEIKKDLTHRRETYYCNLNAAYKSNICMEANQKFST